MIYLIGIVSKKIATEKEISDWVKNTEDYVKLDYMKSKIENIIQVLSSSKNKSEKCENLSNIQQIDFPNSIKRVDHRFCEGTEHESYYMRRSARCNYEVYIS